MTDLMPSQWDLLPWTAPEFLENPYPWYARLRRDHPVYRLEDGSFVVSRYADIMQWAKDPCMSIVEHDQGAWAALENTMLFKDPPEHTRLRRHTNKWFTPKLVIEWAKAAQEVVDETLDGLSEDQIIEAHVELGVKPTHITMCRIMQVSEEDFQAVPAATITAMDAIVAEPTAEADEKAAEALAYLNGRVERMLAAKRENPGDGMADALLAAHDRGELTYREVVETISLFWGSGGHNPGFLVTVGLHEFARQPEMFDTYRDEPAARVPIINEILRYHPPEMSFLRFPMRDIEIRGVHIPEGTQIRFMTASANRDPEVFDNPEDFDFRRPPTARHISFGVGPHSCAGQMISRAETETIFTAIAQRYRRIELAGTPETHHTDRGRNYRKLPIKLIP